MKKKNTKLHANEKEEKTKYDQNTIWTKIMNLSNWREQKISILEKDPKWQNQISNVSIDFGSTLT